MFKKKDHVKKFLRYINSRHRNIKFTFAEEKDNKMSFLDISICRNNNALETSIFRKPTFSGVYTNFDSFLPTVYKSSHQKVFLRKSVPKFKRERPCRSVISIKLLCNFTEITFRHVCSPVNLLHIFKIPLPKNTFWWLLLQL